MSTITRTPSKNPFLLIPQGTVRDSRLTYRARGVLARLLSNADGYKMPSSELAREGGEGRDSIRTCLLELEKFGYIKTVKKQDEKGRFTTETFVYDEPQIIEAPINPPKVKEKRVPPRPIPKIEEFGDYSCELIINNEIGEFKVGTALFEKIKEVSPGIENLELFIKRAAMEFVFTKNRNKVARGQWKLSQWLKWRCAEEQNYLSDIAFFGLIEANKMRRKI